MCIILLFIVLWRYTFQWKYLIKDISNIFFHLHKIINILVKIFPKKDEHHNSLCVCVYCMCLCVGHSILYCPNLSINSAGRSVEWLIWLLWNCILLQNRWPCVQISLNRYHRTSQRYVYCIYNLKYGLACMKKNKSKKRKKEQQTLRYSFVCNFDINCSFLLILRLEVEYFIFFLDFFGKFSIKKLIANKNEIIKCCTDKISNKTIRSQVK